MTHLGPLEKRVLGALWKRGSATVNELLEDDNLNVVAYTTVMTTLDRLHKKLFLNRVMEGRAFRYTPRFTQGELERATAVHMVRQLLESGSSATLPLSYLVEALSEHETQLLDELQRIVEQKCRQLSQQEEASTSE
jgi:predicted transcriptional regulator